MMRERFLSGYDPFVLPFMIGMAFVLIYCIAGIIRIILQLTNNERKKFFISLVTPRTLWKNIKDIICDCLLHVKIWKRKPLLGYMHSSIAFGWFMLILIGHIETWIYIPQRSGLFYYPVFFRYFMEVENYTLRGGFFFFLMDFFLLVVLSGIALAIFKRFRSVVLGMRRTTRLTVLDHIGLYSLWSIFPLRLLAEGFTAGVSGGSFLTVPLNWLFANFFSKPENFTSIWWAYSIALCVFLCVLPFTRYMHIPAEILLIPLRNAGIKVRKPRKGISLAQIYSCSSCGLCLDACPMGVQKKNLKDTTVYLTRQLKRNHLERCKEISEKCLMCGKCQAICPVGVSATELRESFRADIKYNINQDYSYLDKYCNEIAKECPEEKSPNIVQKDFSKRRVLYYAGCMTSLTPVVSKSIKKLLDKAVIDYSLMDENGGICCGRPLMLAGRHEEADSLIRKNTKIIEDSGADILLVSCAICYRVFKQEYHLKGIEVMHYTEYFDKLASCARIEFKESGLKYAYHDPCDLGRGCKIGRAHV